ncbi:hypothetical protein LXA43DRAFT_865192, partial [Ganoderma leucocontextum]
FQEVADKLLSIDIDVLEQLAVHSKDGSYVSASDDAEQSCFELMSIIDHIAGHVAGSNTCRKWQRNELRSLTYVQGTPSFFLTISPGDTKNPICLAMCGVDADLTSVTPKLPSEWDRMLAIADNPVSSAQFFHHVVQGLLMHVLCVNSRDPGVLGPVSAYYGTIE